MMKNYKLQITNYNLKSAICNSRTGLTLIEVLVALAVLAIGLLGVASMQAISITGNTNSREMAVATELAQDMLEKLQASTYTKTAVDSTLQAGSHNNGELYDSNGNAQANPIDAKGMSTDSGGNAVPLRLYTRTWVVTDNSPAVNMKTIDVSVQWTDRTGTQHTVGISGVKVRE